MYSGRKCFKRFKTPLVFIILPLMCCICGFQFKFLLILRPRKLKLSTYSMSLLFIFKAGLITFFPLYGKELLLFFLYLRKVYLSITTYKFFSISEFNLFALASFTDL